MSIRQALINHHEQLYKEYISEHVSNVQRAWQLMKRNKDAMDYIESNLKNMTLDGAISVIDDLIDNHDRSKYRKEEFNAYRKNFYPVDDDEKKNNMSDFNRAWKHHYTNNLHHWNWWYESGNMNNMPFIHIVEMICDWEAMGYKFGNNSKEYYDKNKDEIFLGEKQRAFAEGLMDIICK